MSWRNLTSSSIVSYFEFDDLRNFVSGTLNSMAVDWQQRNQLSRNDIYQYICLLATSCLTERIKCSVFCKFYHCNFQIMRPIIHCFSLGCKHVKIHRTSSLLESTVDHVNFPPLLALAILLISGFHLTTQLLYVTPRNQSYKCRFSSP